MGSIGRVLLNRNSVYLRKFLGTQRVGGSEDTMKKAKTTIMPLAFALLFQKASELIIKKDNEN